MQVVKDLMVPLEAYTRVPETASLYDVVKALEKAMTAPAADPTRLGERRQPLGVARDRRSATPRTVAQHRG